MGAKRCEMNRRVEHEMDNREEAINRTLRILDRFSKKFNVAICLPLLLEQPEFKNNFKRHYAREYEELHKLCIDANYNDRQDDVNECFSKNELPMQIVPYARNIKNTLQWTSILESLSKYEEEILTSLRGKEIFRDYEIIIDRVTSLKEIVEYQMKLTPDKLRERKIALRNAEATIIELSAHIEDLECNYTCETLRYESTLETTRKEISDLNGIISEMRKNHREAFQQKIKSYEATLSELTNDAKEDKSNVENQLNAFEKLIEELRKSNLDREKLLREKCTRTEKERLKALKAYDQDLSKLNESKTNLEEQLGLISKNYEILTNEHNVQAVIYAELKKERELAMMQAFAEQLDNFEKNRAARIIQRTWRAYHERMASKKKKKTRKNK